MGVTDPATGVTDTGVVLNGSVGSSMDGPTTYWFAYGTTVFHGSETPHRTITISDRTSHPVSETVSGLTPATTYHYVVCAQDTTSWPSCGLDQTFTTSPAAAALSISAEPELFPAFDTAVSDYVTRCGASPVTLSVVAPPGTTVAVGDDGLTAEVVELPFVG
jgi:hypothetical protein